MPFGNQQIFHKQNFHSVVALILSFNWIKAWDGEYFNKSKGFEFFAKISWRMLIRDPRV